MSRPSNLSKARNADNALSDLARAGRWLELHRALLAETTDRIEATDSAREAAPLIRLAATLTLEAAETEAALSGGAE